MRTGERDEIMVTRTYLRRITATLSLAVLPVAVGCGQQNGYEAEPVAEAQGAVTEVSHTDVERQSIGNCWLYAAATWVESMNLSYLEANPSGGGGEHTCEHLALRAGSEPDQRLHACRHGSRSVPRAHLRGRLVLL